MQFPVAIQNPFAIRCLPWLLHVYRLGYKPYFSQRQRTWLRMPFRKLHRVLRAVSSPLTGDLFIRTPSGVKAVQFPADNLQYHSVYLPQHLPIYEPEVAAILTVLAPEITCFWDVGSNWGHHTLFLLSQESFTGRVEAFEPNARIADELRSHLLATENQHRARCNSFGLSSRPGKALLKMPDGIHSGLARVTESGFGTEIRLATGDAVDLPPPDLIKLDAEGSEADALEGCKGLLTRVRPALVVELWPRDTVKTNRIVSLLRAQEYVLSYPTFTETHRGSECHEQRAVFHSATGVLELRPLAHGLGLEKLNALAVPQKHRLAINDRT